MADKSGFLFRFENKVKKILEPTLSKDLLQKLREKNHELYLDNFTSYYLVQNLRKDLIYARGTVNETCINLPIFKDIK